MKNIIQLFILLLIIEGSFAQTPDTVWTRVFYGGNEAEAFSVRQTFDGGYVLAGRTRVGIAYKAFLLKTDNQGNQQWDWRDDPAETYVSNLYSVKQTTNGGYIAMGNIARNSVEPMRLYLCCFTSEGDTLWRRAWPDSGLYGAWDGGDVVPTSDGFVVTGLGDQGLIRLDSSGNIIWARDIGGAVKSVVALADGGFACSGVQNETGGLFLHRTNANGESLWSSYYGGGFDGHGNQLIQLADGGFAVCGYHAFIRTDSWGEIQWVSQTNLTFGNLMAVTETWDGGFLTAGCRGSSDCNIFVAKYNSSGDTLWTKTWGSSLTDVAHAVLQVSDSSYLVAGSYGYAEPNPWTAAYLAKLQENTHSGSPHRADLPKGYALSAFPNPFNPSTTISFSLPRAGEVKMAVYDVTGRLTDGHVRAMSLQAGEHHFTFDGAGLASGIYFARLESAGVVKTQKLLLLK